MVNIVPSPPLRSSAAGATPAPVAPWTASPGATWAPVAPVAPWTGPPTVALLDLLTTTRDANAEGEFEGQFDTVLAGLEYADLSSLLEGQSLMTVSCWRVFDMSFFFLFFFCGFFHPAQRLDLFTPASRRVLVGYSCLVVRSFSCASRLAVVGATSSAHDLRRQQVVGNARATPAPHPSCFVTRFIPAADADADAAAAAPAGRCCSPCFPRMNATRTQVFLPTDDAFEAEGINATSVTSLPQPVVQNLLRYHLLEGAVSSEVLAEAADLYTVLKVTSV